MALLGCAFLPNVSAATHNYADALQKAIYFYECQVAGPKPSWNRVQWRGDSCLNDNVPGGWLDAGDHVKFGLPMAYSASMLGWSIYEYGPAMEMAGQLDHLKNNLKFVLDYFVKCDLGTSMVYQIGNPGPDHSWWGPVEVVEKKMTRPYYTGNGSCVCGQTAAALAIGSIIFKDNTYLTHAKSLFQLADTVRSDANYTAASGFYSSWSGYADELMWASIWLYLATNDSNYLTKAETYLDSLQRAGQDDPRIQFKWTQCWDDVHYGAILLLARLTGKQVYHDFMKLYLDWWTVGSAADGRVTYTPGGLAWLDTWGSLRYATATAFVAGLYSDLVADAALKERYAGFAKNQVDYCLGSNPSSFSYEIGYGTKYPMHPHHRTAHGSWCDQQTTPPYHRHTLFGALVGGPDSSDGYQDVISNYTTNEVACDYNAGFVAILARMCSLYGGTPSSGFPPREIPEDEFFVEAQLNSTGNDYTEIKAFINNRSAWPCRLLKNLSYNYYMDLSEVFAAGYTVADLKVTLNGSQVPATVSPITQYSGNIYYIKINYNGNGEGIAPIDQSSYAREATFRISAKNGTTFWNPANDYSYQGITSTRTKTQYITVYDGDTLIFGKEPNGGTPPPATPTPVVTGTPTPVRTLSPTATVTPVVPGTPTPARTATPTRTATPRRTVTPIRTATPAVTATPTPVRTATPLTTAAPTPVSTATSPVVTPTPVPTTGNIKLQFYNQSTAATSNQVYANFKLMNTGTSAIVLSNVKIRYYYTVDGVKAQTFYCDYASIGGSNVTGSFVTMATPKTGADTYLEVGFASGAGSLAAGANAIIQGRFAKSDWTNYNQANDYSFNSSATTYADWTKITGYVSGALQWGTEP